MSNEDVPEIGAVVGRKLVMTRAVREATIEAAERIGFDGNGKDGLVGYLMRMAYKRPDNFDTMLMRMLPLSLPEGPGGAPQEYKTVEEVRRAIRERALPMPESLRQNTPSIDDESIQDLDRMQREEATVVAEAISEEEFENRGRRR